MTIEEFLDAKDPDVNDCIKACIDYVGKNPIFNGENLINLIGENVTGLLFFTYTEEDKLRKIKEISKEPKGNRRMLIGNYLYSLYAISKDSIEYSKIQALFNS